MEMTLPDESERRPEDDPLRRAVLAVTPGDRPDDLLLGWYAARSNLGEALHVHLILEPSRVVGDGTWDRVLLDAEACISLFRETESVARRLDVPVVGFRVRRDGWEWAACDANGRIGGRTHEEGEGDLARVAELFGVSIELLRAYSQGGGGKVHAEDGFHLDDPWVHIDLAHKLGFDYPHPAAQRSLEVRAGEALVTKDGVMRVVQVEGLKAFLMTAGRAQPVRNPLPLELDQIAQWRPVLDRHEAERILDRLGNQVHQAERPIPRDARLKLAQRAKDRLWDPKDLVDVLVNLAAASRAREWLSPVETKNRDAAKKHLVAEISAATATEPGHVEQKLARLGF
jgi:hypothetical protein